MQQYILPGIPVSMARPRFNKKTGAVFNCQAQQLNDQKLILRAQASKFERVSGPLIISVVLFMPIPQSWSKKKREAFHLQPHISRPDLDNMVKWIGDVGNGILYDDDAVICAMHAYKFYSLEPKTVISIGLFDVCQFQKVNNFVRMEGL